jgi:HAD superfamily hydrolase (TIGR01450 family)
MKAYQTFLLDLDGVIYRGDLLLPGAREFVAWMETTGKRYRYLTNNSMIGPAAVAAKLSRLGIPTTAVQVVTASDAAVHLIARRWPGARCWIVALPPIRQMAVAAGLHVLNLHYSDAPDDPRLGPESAQIVLVGLDRSLTYEGLRCALRAVLAGAEFIAVNRDPVLPVEDGFDPGCGAILSALEFASRRQASIVGKPAPELLIETLAELDASPATAVMIGDAIEMDITAGHNAGIDTILVLSGNTSAERAATAQPAPTIIAQDLADVLRLMQMGT